CGKKIGPDPRNFNQRVSLGRNDLLIRTFLSFPLYLLHELVIVSGFIFDAENAWVSISLAAFASIFIAYIYARFIDYPLYRALKRQIAKIS
ncbi:hypothetical protein ABQ482_22360, partial [Raoultella ornithinolytica]